MRKIHNFPLIIKEKKTKSSPSAYPFATYNISFRFLLIFFENFFTFLWESNLCDNNDFGETSMNIQISGSKKWKKSFQPFF
jgi:hypothetical protein